MVTSAFERFPSRITGAVLGLRVEHDRRYAATLKK